MKKSHRAVLVLSLLFVGTLSSQVFGQTYQGDVPGSINTLAQFPNASSGLISSATTPAGTVTLQFTIDPVASTFRFDSLTFKNLTLPTITTTYALGFGSGTQANVTITFNPLNFVLNAPPVFPGAPNPVPLTSASGFSQPTYQPSYTGVNTSFSDLNLTGSYSITSSVGSASGTFSDPITFIDVFLNPDIQTSGYPNTLNLFSGGGYQLRLNQAPTPLFTATVNGTTISPLFDDGQGNNDFGTPVITSTTFHAVIPEPSASALTMGGLGVLFFLGRHHARRT